MQETQVRSLGQEDPMEKEMATHSSILAWETTRTEEPDGLESMGSQRGRHNLVTEQQRREQFNKACDKTGPKYRAQERVVRHLRGPSML